MIDFYFVCDNCKNEIKCPSNNIPKHAFCPHCNWEVFPGKAFNEEQSSIKKQKQAKEAAEEQEKEKHLLDQLNKQSFTKAHLKNLEHELQLLNEFDKNKEVPYLEPDKSFLSILCLILMAIIAFSGIITTTMLSVKYGFLAFLTFVGTIISCFVIYCFGWIIHQIRVSNTLKKQQILLLTIIRNSLFNH